MVDQVAADQTVNGAAVQADDACDFGERLSSRHQKDRLDAAKYPRLLGSTQGTSQTAQIPRDKSKCLWTQ